MVAPRRNIYLEGFRENVLEGNDTYTEIKTNRSKLRKIKVSKINKVVGISELWLRISRDDSLQSKQKGFSMT